jgi:mannan endo-1,4-beta-mannosidase
MRRMAYLAISVILALSACSRGKIRTADPNASPEARKLLDFLYEIKGKYILSGQHNFIVAGSKYSDLIKENTGKYPIVWGSDFSFCYEGNEPVLYQHCGPINLPDPETMTSYEAIQSLDVEITDLTPREARRRLVETAITKHREGCIITLMWHCCPPGYADYCDGNRIWATDNRLAPREWSELITEGTALNNAWKAQADEIAFYLKQLRDAGVPVLWRPYHEMNGEWFWWGNWKGRNGFEKLWIMMFDYFVNHHGLHNLLWVWNPNAPRNIEGDTAFPYEDFWPGIDYVDVLAADVYRNDWKQSHYDELQRLARGKPIAIGTAAPLPDARVLATQSDWVWFMSWGNRVLWGNGIDRFNELYGSGRALSLEDVDSSDGEYRLNLHE